MKTIQAIGDQIIVENIVPDSLDGIIIPETYDVRGAKAKYFTAKVVSVGDDLRIFGSCFSIVNPPVPGDTVVIDNQYSTSKEFKLGESKFTKLPISFIVAIIPNESNNKP